MGDHCWGLPWLCWQALVLLQIIVSLQAELLPVDGLLDGGFPGKVDRFKWLG